MWELVRRDPRALLNPLELLFELFRPDYFKRVQFDGPAGDPGWFGPDSAAWYVHTHTPTVLIGTVNTALVDILHQDIQYAVYDHSKLPGRNADGTVRSGTFSGRGAIVRGGHTFSFFTGVVYGSTETAESLCRTVKAMHSQVKGRRPDGKAYDADDPEFFRWAYASVVDGFAAAHERYHPKPLQGKDLDQFYREYARVGTALGGVDLPMTKADCHRVLCESLSAAEVGLNADNVKYIETLFQPPGARLSKPIYDFYYWLVMDMMPLPVQEAVGFEQPKPAVRKAYRRLGKVLLNAPRVFGEIHEVRQAYARVAGAADRAPIERRSA